MTANVSDDRVELGYAIIGLVEPHPGQHHAWNRYYERDHLIAVGSSAPWTMSSQRWLATRRHKAVRYPLENPIAQPADKGVFVAGLWIQNDRLEEQQAWVADQMKVSNAKGRVFDERDVITTASYRYLGGSFRDEDGVPPELALDRRYPGLVLAWVEKKAGSSVESLADALRADVLPGMLEDSAIAQALCFTPLPKASWWPKASPEVPGVDERVLVTFFVECDALEIWDAAFVGLGKVIDESGCGSLLFVAPFVPVVPGVDADLATL